MTSIKLCVQDFSEGTQPIDQNIDARKSSIADKLDACIPDLEQDRQTRAESKSINGNLRALLVGGCVEERGGRRITHAQVTLFSTVCCGSF